MSEKEIAEKTQAQILRDVFEGVKGRQPRSEQEFALGRDGAVISAVRWILCSTRRTGTHAQLFLA